MARWLGPWKKFWLVCHYFYLKPRPPKGMGCCNPYDFFKQLILPNKRRQTLQCKYFYILYASFDVYQVKIKGCRLGMGSWKRMGGWWNNTILILPISLNIWQAMCASNLLCRWESSFPNISSQRSCEIPCFYDFFSESLFFANFHVYFQCIEISDGALTLWRHSDVIWSSKALNLISIDWEGPYL